MNVFDIIGLPDWLPRWSRRDTRRSGREIRKLLLEFTGRRTREIEAGTAPDDLATAIMTTADPETGHVFDEREMVDQVAIFFLAGHETSAAALAWTLYIIANDPETQERMAAEAKDALGERNPEFADMRKMPFIRDVFREGLRLYPPVAMMVRQATRDEEMRDKTVRKGSPVLISPWHLHRHERIWERPDEFDPDRWRTEAGRECGRKAYIPFSTGPRVCPGAAFALQEGVLLLSLLVRAFRITPVEGREPRPTTQLTVRSEDGVWLRLTPRE